MEDVTTKQFYFGLIAHDEDRAIPMEVLSALEDKLNEEVDLLSLDTPLRKLYITVDFTATEEEPTLLTKKEEAVLEVEVLLNRSVLTNAAEFEGVLRRVLRDGLEGMPEEVLSYF
ncbi:hypothetical protein [Phaeodactylibacter luteus]|uniref:Uncharacterized protein n=1 Tax=Phaeodactylibacter luteus TaxID=1564516 RepID=A0A5C6S162_9BACT|nr:hypothetical protein [Phaeodactylibacter luteus]TXB68348.1 hypothetical protein FRY97_02920 [Phaeodactylibacter luteus]